MNLSDLIDDYCKKRNISYARFADILFVSSSTVTAWRAGKNFPHQGSLKDLSVLLNIPIDDLKKLR